MVQAVKKWPELPTEGMDTPPKLFLRNCHYLSDMVAMRQKQYGIWNEITWQQSYEKVKYVTLGLLSLGCEPGDRIGFMGDNEPELYWAVFATWCAGGVGCGVWVDSVPSEVKFYVTFAEAKFVFARDQEQVDKLLKIKEELTPVRKVIWWQPRGMNAAVYRDDPWLISFEELIELGRQYEEQNPAAFNESIERVKPDDICFLYYTSGTTGLPKAVMRTHKSQMLLREQCQPFFPMSAGDDTVCYFQTASFAEPTLGSISHLAVGLILNFVESPDTMQEDLREISPTCIMWFPRQWEDIASAIQVKVNDAGFIKRTIFNLFLPVGFKVADLAMHGEKVAFLWKCVHKFAWWLSFRAVLDKFGLFKTKWGITGGYVLGEHTFRFLRAIGIDLRQAFGITELGFVSAHTPEDIKIDSVGKFFSDTEVRISEAGELCGRSAAMFSGYYKNPTATKEAVDEGGWYHSGDAAYIDHSGRLYYIDRVSELKCLASGLKFSPQYVEAQMRFGAYVKDCMALGDENKEYVSAVINIDFESVGKWAEKNQIPYTTLVDLSQKEEVGRLVLRDILRANRTIPEHAQIKKYAIFHKEFDPDESELTRTRKLRRVFMEEKYADLIQAMYEGKKSIPVTATVTYRDGRTGTVSADIKIRNTVEESIKNGAT